MINLSRNFLRAFLRRAFSADGSLSRGGRFRLPRRRSPKKRRIAFAWEEGGAFMIFAGSGKDTGFRVPCATEGGGRLRLPFPRGGGGQCLLRFFGPEEQRGGGRSSDFSVADGEGWPSPASCRSRSHVPASRGRQRRRSVRHAGGALGGGRSDLPSARGLFGVPPQRATFFGAVRFCGQRGSDGAAPCPVDRADARVYPREK